MPPGPVDAVSAAPKRANYHSPLRQRQAAATRRAIVDAAISLFSDRGWANTTLPMVAGEAGTAVDTIYSTFGSKSGLLMAAVDLAIAGDDSPVAMVDRPEIAAFGTGTITERLRTGVHFTLDVYERSVPILHALQEAAASDEPARRRLEKYDDDRRRVVVVGLHAMLGQPPTDVVVDAFWALVSPEVFVLLTDRLRWTRIQTEEWLVDQCAATLAHLADPDRP